MMFALTRGMGRYPRLKRGSILDAGCGSGIYSIETAKRFSGASVTALDSDPKVITDLMATKNSTGLRNLSVRQENLEELDDKDRFDGVISFNSLHYFLEGDVEILKKFRRALRVGGVLFLVVPVSHKKRVYFFPSFNAREEWEGLDPGETRIHYGRELNERLLREKYTREEILARLKAAGFRVERVRYYLGFFGALAWELERICRTRLLPYFFLYPLLASLAWLDRLVPPKKGNALYVEAVKEKLRKEPVRACPAEKRRKLSVPPFWAPKFPEGKSGAVVLYWDYELQGGADRCLKGPKDWGTSDYTWTEWLLKVLDERSVRCAFAVLGRAAEEGSLPYHAPEQVRLLADAGHEIASHSLGHEFLPRLKIPELFETVVRSKELLERVTRKEVVSFVPPHDYPTRFLRKFAPGINQTLKSKKLFSMSIPSLMKALGKAGYKTCRIAYSSLGDRALSLCGGDPEFCDGEFIEGVFALNKRVTGFPPKIPALLEKAVRTSRVLTVSAHPHSLSSTGFQGSRFFLGFLEKIVELRDAGLWITTPAEILSFREGADRFTYRVIGADDGSPVYKLKGPRDVPVSFAATGSVKGYDGDIEPSSKGLFNISGEGTMKVEPLEKVS
jgi:SAM-dependent methyltransferase